MRTRSVAPIRTAKIGYMVISAAFCILGILLIAVPRFSASLLGVICGILLIAFGCVRLTGYFSKDLYRLAFQYDLSFGILLIVLGIIMLTHPAGLMTFICASLGLFILADGIFKIQIAVESKKFGLQTWWLILVLAVLTGICGLTLLFRPGAGSRLLMILLGITLLSEGILNFSTGIAAVKIIRYQKPDTIEVEWREKNEI